MLKNVYVHELHEQLESDSQAVLIDVRTPSEFAAGHVPQAHNLPLGEMSRAEIVAEWSRDAEGKMIYFICETGVKSQRFVDDMAKDGFEGAQCVTGGMIAWQAAGLPLARAKKRRAEMSAERRGHLACGLAVIAGCVLGATVNPWFFAVPAVLGALLCVEGLRGTSPLTGLMRHRAHHR